LLIQFGWSDLCVFVEEEEEEERNTMGWFIPHHTHVFLSVKNPSEFGEGFIRHGPPRARTKRSVVGKGFINHGPPPNKESIGSVCSVRSNMLLAGQYIYIIVIITTHYTF
jgi:hypothetical protein